MPGTQRRTDNKGRILKTGESQRSDGRYQYRWKAKNSQTYDYVYAPTLAELREKEKAVERDLLDGIDLHAGRQTVSERIDEYLKSKKKLKASSRESYMKILAPVRNDPIMKMQIRDVKYTDIKSFYLRKHDDGFKRNSILSLNRIFHPAFQEAVEDDVIRKNPCIMSKILPDIPDDGTTRIPLSEDQEKRFLAFAEKKNFRFTDQMIILIETGMRIGELCGLTLQDVDLANRILNVDKQLQYVDKQGLHIQPPKSDAGIRKIPLTNRAVEAFKRVIDKREQPKVEPMIDGVCGFLFIMKNGSPLRVTYLKDAIHKLEQAYQEEFKDDMPSISAHVFRHTFATRQSQKGLDPKSLSGIIGHSSVDMTNAVYIHYDEDFAEKSFHAIND